MYINQHLKLCWGRKLLISLMSHEEAIGTAQNITNVNQEKIKKQILELLINMSFSKIKIKQISFVSFLYHNLKQM